MEIGSVRCGIGQREEEQKKMTKKRRKKQSRKKVPLKVGEINLDL